MVNDGLSKGAADKGKGKGVGLKVGGDMKGGTGKGVSGGKGDGRNAWAWGPPPGLTKGGGLW